MHPACMHVNTCTYIPQHTSTSIQLNRYTQKYMNLWLWPKRPPLAFYMAEMSVAEMSWPKCPWPKRPWPKYPTFQFIHELKIAKRNHMPRKHTSNMSRIVRKPAFCICKNKDADQLRNNCETDQRLCFRYSDSAIPLLPKSEISSL